jgi:hypothetical protein
MTPPPLLNRPSARKAAEPEPEDPVVTEAQRRKIGNLSAILEPDEIAERMRLPLHIIKATLDSLNAQRRKAA